MSGEVAAGGLRQAPGRKNDVVVHARHEVDDGFRGGGRPPGGPPRPAPHGGGDWDGGSQPDTDDNGSVCNGSRSR